MKLTKKSASIITFFVLFIISFATGQERFQKTTTFYPETDIFNDEEIVWGKLAVPEDWNAPGKQISLAVAILKNTSVNSNANAIVYIPGGPGGDGISSILYWLNHPLRSENDIVLMDIRGTGFSQPRLCPDLGKEFLKILAKNQSANEDEKQKVAAALSCKNQLSIADIEVTNYNSWSVARDLNSLKTELGYSKWHVYGVSYGTFMAQVYMNEFPEDIESMLLDSAIADITKYYTENTSGYMTSILKVFDQCKNNPECNSRYPNLKKKYYQTIIQLQEQPLTVDVDPEVLDSESFTYNAEDFKVALQQGLYNKNLIELMPLLITAFHNRNEAVLGTLVAAFSEALEMDYGVYYCVSCNEVLPWNDLSAFEEDAAKYKELKGGLSFYKTDFNVCEVWNQNIKDTLQLDRDTSNVINSDIPVLIFSGGFDPITPPKNGKKLLETFNGSYLIHAPNHGHVPGFSEESGQLALEFVQNPSIEPNAEAFNGKSKIKFVQDIKLNSGVMNMGLSLNEPDLLFIGPLLMALGIAISFIFVHLINLFRKRYVTIPNRVIRVLIILTSLIGIASLFGLIFAIIQVVQQNFYTLIFGLPESYGYLFTGILIFIGLLLLSILYMVRYFKKIENRSIIISVVFSNVLLATYLFYWQII